MAVYMDSLGRPIPVSPFETQEEALNRQIEEARNESLIRSIPDIPWSGAILQGPPPLPTQAEPGAINPSDIFAQGGLPGIRGFGPMGDPIPEVGPLPDIGLQRGAAPIGGREMGITLPPRPTPPQSKPNFQLRPEQVLNKDALKPGFGGQLFDPNRDWTEPPQDITWTNAPLAGPPIEVSPEEQYAVTEKSLKSALPQWQSYDDAYKKRAADREAQYQRIVDIVKQGYPTGEQTMGQRPLLTEEQVSALPPIGKLFYNLTKAAGIGLSPVGSRNLYDLTSKYDQAVGQHNLIRAKTIMDAQLKAMEKKELAENQDREKALKFYEAIANKNPMLWAQPDFTMKVSGLLDIPPDQMRTFIEANMDDKGNVRLVLPPGELEAITDATKTRSKINLFTSLGYSLQEATDLAVGKTYDPLKELQRKYVMTRDPKYLEGIRTLKEAEKGPTSEEQNLNAALKWGSLYANIKKDQYIASGKSAPEAAALAAKDWQEYNTATLYQFATRDKPSDVVDTKRKELINQYDPLIAKKYGAEAFYEHIWKTLHPTTPREEQNWGALDPILGWLADQKMTLPTTLNALAKMGSDSFLRRDYETRIYGIINNHAPFGDIINKVNMGLKAKGQPPLTPSEVTNNLANVLIGSEKSGKLNDLNVSAGNLADAITQMRLLQK